MTKYIIESTTLTDIANSIREKTGKSDKMLPSEMPNEIQSIQTGVSNAKINDAGYLFYYGRRIENYRELMALCENVIDTTSMFNNVKISEIDLSGFDTSNVTSMENMFYFCSAVTSLDLSKFDTSSVTKMNNMFGFCGALTKLDLSNFNTKNVTNMQGMFAQASNIETIDVSSFNTEKVTGMYNMFGGMRSLKKLDISSFSTAVVTSMSAMFSDCTLLDTLIINNPEMFELKATDCFSGTPIASGKGYIYVPDDMVETYKTATNWNVYADQIKPISELPEGV